MLPAERVSVSDRGSALLIRSIHDPRIEAALDEAYRRAAGGGRKPFPSPPDWRPHWIYFLLLDRFNNPDRPPVKPWQAETFSPQGGTFEGVRRQLGYLRDLGAGALWLSPFLREQQFCYGYGPQNFLAVDPRYGSEDDLIRLIDEAHALGLFVIADIVAHHAGDVFAYRYQEGLTWFAPWSETVYPAVWRDADYTPRWEEEAPADCHEGAAVWPLELRDPRCFRRQGQWDPGDPVRGDLHWLKEFDLDHRVQRAAGGRSSWSVLNVLIRIYQYWIAKLDLDGLRLDSLKHIELHSAKRFCTTIREHARSLGKTNFLLLGEVRGEIEEIAPYIGREPGDPEGEQITDSCILFPFSQALRQVVKDGGDCRALRRGHRAWALALADRCRGAGDPVSQMVTMIDDHDTMERFFDGRPDGENDVVMALTWLFVSPGTPCIYYGTEQGLHGRASEKAIRDNWLFEAVREALWGKPGAFDPQHRFYQTIRELSGLRKDHPALTFGRTYWRPLSRNGWQFSFDECERGVLALSRINEPEEVLIVANWHRQESWNGSVLIDLDGNAEGRRWALLFSSRSTPPSRFIVERVEDAALRDDGGADGPSVAHCLRVEAGPREILVLGREHLPARQS